MNILESFAPENNNMKIQSIWLSLSGMSPKKLREVINIISRNPDVLRFYKNDFVPQITNATNSISDALKEIKESPALYTNFLTLISNILLPFINNTMVNAFNNPSNVSENDLNDMKSTIDVIAYNQQIYILCAHDFCNLVWAILNSVGVFFISILSQVPPPPPPPPGNTTSSIEYDLADISSNEISPPIIVKGNAIQMVKGTLIADSKSIVNINDDDTLNMFQEIKNILYKYKYYVIVFIVIILIVLILCIVKIFL